MVRIPLRLCVCVWPISLSDSMQSSQADSDWIVFWCCLIEKDTNYNASKQDKPSQTPSVTPLLVNIISKSEHIFTHQESTSDYYFGVIRWDEFGAWVEVHVQDEVASRYRSWRRESLREPYVTSPAVNMQSAGELIKIDHSPATSSVPQTRLCLH